MKKQKQQSVRYSDAFKRQVVAAIEEGRYATYLLAARAYGVGSVSTIGLWVERFGSPDIQRKVIRVETPKERSALGMSKKRVKDLETALSDAHIDYTLEHAYLELACEKLGMDLGDFKKKYGLTLSDVRRRKGSQ